MKQDKKQSILFYTAALLLPAVLYIAMLAIVGVMPFGSEYSIAYVDADGQYLSFFSYYRQMMQGEQSWLFSFSKLIGGDMVGFGAYYLLSPFNFILLLFPAHKMAQAMAVMAVAKIAAAGLTSVLFFEHHLGRNEKTFFLSTAFALMSYNIIYMQNIMWIDGVIMLPLIALGIDRIVEKKSSALYIFSLFYGIFVNYYIGFMLCGASVIYFGYRFICDEFSFKDKLISAVRYGFSSVFAGAMNAVIILPVLKSLEGTTKAGMPLNELIGLQTQLSFRDLAKHLIFPSATMGNIETMLPNVFAGFVVTALCVLFVVMPKISWKKKIAGGMIAVFFLLSFYFKTLYYFWHGFAKPICFEYRFAFVFTFFMLLWAGEYLSTVKRRKILIIALAAINCATLLWYGTANYKASVHDLHHNEFEAFMLEGQPIIADIEKLEEADGSFYRVEKDYYYNYNDAMALGYSGMTHFSSGEQLATRKAVQAAGFAFTEMYGYYGNGSTAASESMFGIEYLMFRNRVKAGLDLVGNYGNIELYRNQYAWPLAIKADSAVADMDIGEVTRGLLAQEMLANAWGKEYDLSAKIDFEVTTEEVDIYTTEEGYVCYDPEDLAENRYVHFTFTSPADTNIYMNLVTEGRNVIKAVTCGDVEIKRYPGYYDHGIRFLTTAKKGEEITVTFEMRDNLVAEDLMFLYDNWTELDAVQGRMATDSYKDTGFDGDSFTVTGTMDQTEGMLLMIPYNEGWTVEINGVDTPYRSVVENFVYVDVPQGDFVMNVSYFPPRLAIGAAVSAVVLAVCLAYLFVEKKKLK